MQVVGEEQVQETQPSEKKDGNMFDDVENSTARETVDTDASAQARQVEKTDRLDGRTQINTSDYPREYLVITADEKSAFIDAMVTGSRYRESFDLFGGRLHVTLRSRTQEETNAMYAYIRHTLSKPGGNVSMMEGELSFVPLVAQVEEINGTKFPEMAGPLTYENIDGKETEPGWMPAFNAWKEKPEGLTSAISNILHLFEYKYWLMVKEAANKNFWNSDTSIDG